MGDIELQKLGVVPQTVFLKNRTSSESISRYSRLTSSSRRSTLDISDRRTPLLSPNYSNRMLSADYSASGTPFEDLRRRLQTISGSVSPVGSGPPPISRGNFSPVTPSISSVSHPASGLPQTHGRPSSPTESILSAANSQTYRPTSRLLIGSTDGQKAAPAVGPSKANATGLLDTHSKIRSEESPDLSGRSSPISMSATLRPRSRVPSALQISTYGSILVQVSDTESY